MKKVKKKFWPEFFRYIAFTGFVLLLVILISLSRGAAFSSPPDAMSEVREAVKQFFPNFDNDPLHEAFFVGTVKVYPVRRRTVREDSQGNFSESYPMTGFIFKAPGKGYAGPLELLVAANADGTVRGVRLAGHREPLGFGHGFSAQREFFRQMTGCPSGELFLDDEGGNLHAVSSATVTSRGVVKAVREAMAALKENPELSGEKLTPAAGQGVV